MASFKEVKGMVPISEQITESKESAASKILATHSTKDKRVYARISESTYEQFNKINNKLGTNNSSVINVLIAEYILKYKHYLED